MNIPKTLKAATAAILVSGFTLSALSAQTAENLLKNTEFLPSEDGSIPDWRFSTWNLEGNPALHKGIEWQAEELPDGTRCLSIKAKNPLRAHVWWQQTQEVTGSGTYELSVRAKATFNPDNTKATLSVGIHFMDAGGQWLGYQSVVASPALSGDWEVVSGSVVVPESAAKIGIRCGVDFDGAVEVAFKEPVLKSE